AAGIRSGRTVVMLEGPDDPMVELTASVALAGDVVAAASPTLIARVTGGAGGELVFFADGVEVARMPIPSDDFTGELATEAPATGQKRVRAEVWIDDAPRSVTSHLWLVTAEEEGCGCRVAGAPSRGGPLFVLLGGLALGLFARRRRGDC